jgi:hypothetical protein
MRWVGGRFFPSSFVFFFFFFFFFFPFFFFFFNDSFSLSIVQLWWGERVDGFFWQVGPFSLHAR